jgi:hypothetical protein
MPSTGFILVIHYSTTTRKDGRVGRTVAWKESQRACQPALCRQDYRALVMELGLHDRQSQQLSSSRLPNYRAATLSRTTILRVPDHGQLGSPKLTPRLSPPNRDAPTTKVSKNRALKSDAIVAGPRDHEGACLTRLSQPSEELSVLIRAVPTGQPPAKGVV